MATMAWCFIHKGRSACFGMGVLGAQHRLKSNRNHRHPIITPPYLDIHLNTRNCNTPPRQGGLATRPPPAADDHHHQGVGTPHRHTLFQRQLRYCPLPLQCGSTHRHLNLNLTNTSSSQPKPKKFKMTVTTPNPSKPPYQHERHIAELAVQRASLLTRRVLAGILNPSSTSTSSTSTSGTSTPQLHHDDHPACRVSVASISKPDFSPVTAADFAVQALLTAAIRAHFPHDGFIGEEDADALRGDPVLARQVFDLVRSCASTELGDEAFSPALPQTIPEMLSLIDLGGRGTGSPTARFWAMDPIDGTAAFMRGQQYAVSLCLIEGGREVVGVLGCPNLGITLPSSSSASPQTNTCTATYIISEDSTPSPSPDTQDQDQQQTTNGILLSAVRSQGATIRPIADQTSPTDLLPAIPLTKSSSFTKNPQTTPPDMSNLHFIDSLSTPATSSSLVARVATLAGVPNYSFPGTELYSSHMRYVAMILGGPSHVQVRIPKPRTKATYIWDHAGAQLIYVEATAGKGKVTDLWGRPIDYGRGRKLDGNWGVITAHEEVSGRLLEIVSGIVG
ncbi:carbohydrate phosphatase [Neurospora hispaniola]|uniref:Carbohydrate phosphatase n=1 Tax=Neurospora hispaniola TaxID=588809 RepID=A0AAJ0HYR7_9PEZI|nr:carbohydrate phosphatase [Neurospora hispaniola]